MTYLQLSPSSYKWAWAEILSTAAKKCATLCLVCYEKDALLTGERQTLQEAVGYSGVGPQKSDDDDELCCGYIINILQPKNPYNYLSVYMCVR